MFNSSRQYREQSLDRRFKLPPGALKKYGKDFGIGMGATMAFSYLFEKLGGSSSKEATAVAKSGAGSKTASGADTANNVNNQAYPGYSTSTNTGYSPSTNTGYSPSTNTGYLPSTNPGYSPSTNTGYLPSTNPGYSPSAGPGYYSPSTNPSYSTSTNPTAQTQNGYQQRAVDRDLLGDIYGEPHFES
jgi:hypothetical protein